MSRLINKIKHSYLNWKWSKKNRQEIFTDIFENKRWGNKESVSGGGSMVSSSKMLRSYLPFLFNSLHIKSVIDLACGDFNWMRHVPLASIDYLGMDIVEKLIVDNRKKYGNESIHFKVFDAVINPIEAYDLIICRDLMVHQNEEDNLKLLRNIKNSNSKYLLATTFVEEENNEQCLTGNWRAINLQKPPYDLPNPLILLNEMPYSTYKNTPIKYIGLWEIASI